MLLYILFFLIDDIVIFVIAMKKKSGFLFIAPAYRKPIITKH